MAGAGGILASWSRSATGACESSITSASFAATGTGGGPEASSTAMDGGGPRASSSSEGNGEWEGEWARGAGAPVTAVRLGLGAIWVAQRSL